MLVYKTGVDLQAINKIFCIMYSNPIFPITDLPCGLGLNFFSLVSKAIDNRHDYDLSKIFKKTLTQKIFYKNPNNQ